MVTVLKPGWSKPSTILFASEILANEKAFAFALRRASEFGADLILFHAYDTLVVAASNLGHSLLRLCRRRVAKWKHLEPLAQQARGCRPSLRGDRASGLAADQILARIPASERSTGLMGTHSPGPIGKLLVGSVAEAVLRTSTVPVCIVGPDVVDGAYRNFATKTVLCALSLLDTSTVVAHFAAELASQHNARLLLQHVIRPQASRQVLAAHTVKASERDLLRLDRGAAGQDLCQAIVVPGDPTEELLTRLARQAIYRARRPGCFGLRRHHPARGRLQGARACAQPGDDSLARGAGAMRRDWGTPAERGGNFSGRGLLRSQGLVRGLSRIEAPTDARMQSPAPTTLPAPRFGPCRTTFRRRPLARARSSDPGPIG